MILDTEVQRRNLLMCIDAAVPAAVKGADQQSVSNLAELAALRQQVEAAEVPAPAEPEPDAPALV